MRDDQLDRRFRQLLLFVKRNQDQHGWLALTDSGAFNSQGTKCLSESQMPFDQQTRDHYFQLAVDEGYLTLKDGQWDAIFSAVRITPKGHAFLYEGFGSRRRQQWIALKRNALTILVAVTISLLSVWAVDFWGPNIDNGEGRSQELAPE